MSQFTKKQFNALLKWKMASDPWPVDPTSKAIVEDTLNKEAQARGYNDWVEAYHNTWGDTQ